MNTEIEKKKSISGELLRKKGRNIAMPVVLEVASAQGRKTIICEEILRFLPNKRIVFRALLNNRQIFIKVYFGKGHKHRAQAEWVGVKKMQQAGCLVAKGLFEGDLHKGACLAFEWLDKAQSFTQMENLLPQDQFISLMENSLKLIASLHNAGFIQQDIHLDNFLLVNGNIYCVDGDQVKGTRGCLLSHKDRTHNLALYFAQLTPKFDPFMAKWVQIYNQNVLVSELDGAVVIEKMTHLRRQRIRKYQKKTQRTCTEFIVEKRLSSVLFFRRKDEKSTWRKFLNSLDMVMSLGTVLKKGRSSTVVHYRFEERDLVIKRYEFLNVANCLRRSLRRSRALGSWRSSHGLKFLGVKTPMPLAVLERRLGPLRGVSYLVMEFTQAPTVADVYSQRAPDDEGFAFFETLFRALQVGWVSHGDMKNSNFLYDSQEISLIDLDAMRYHRFYHIFNRAFYKDMQRFLLNWKDYPGWRRLAVKLASLTSRELIED